MTITTNKTQPMTINVIISLESIASYVPKNLSISVFERERQGKLWHVPNPTPHTFITNVAASIALVKRLKLHKKLECHEGCVNTVNWNETGDLLISGSDDTQICIWDYHRNGRLVTNFQTGHTANIFCAKFVPATNSEMVISCAGDAQIRVFSLKQVTSKERPEPYRLYDCHKGRVKKVVFIDPFVFLSVSEDSTVRLIDIRESHSCDSVSCERNIVVDLSSLRTAPEIYSIGYSDPYFCIGGGDPLVRVYDKRLLKPGPNNNPDTVKKFAPAHLSKFANSSAIVLSFRGHITGVAFRGNEILASYSGDNIFLFDMNETKEAPLSTLDNNTNNKRKKPEGNKVPSGPDRKSKRKRAPESSSSESRDSPKESKHSSKKKDKKSDKKRSDKKKSTDDKRSKEEKSEKTDDDDDDDSDDESEGSDSSASAPEAYSTSPYYKKMYFGHCNVRTVKEVNFFGPRHEYVVSGSDDGHIFIWHKDSMQLVHLLKGDRHVVNCIQGHPFDCVMATSGIEKYVKLWAPLDETPPANDKNRLTEWQKIMETNKARVAEGISGNAIPLSLFRTLLHHLRARERQRESGARNPQSSSQQTGSSSGNQDSTAETRDRETATRDSDDDSDIECRIQ